MLLEKKSDERLKLVELIPIQSIQNLQNGFANSYNIPTVILDPNNDAITKQSRQTDFCKYVQSSEKGRAKCKECHKEIFNQIKNKHKTYIRRGCILSNIVTGYVPIIINKELLAYISIGELIEKENDKKEINELANQLDLNYEKLLKASDTLVFIDNENFDTAIKFLTSLAELLSSLAEEKLKQDLLLKQYKESENNLSQSQKNFETLIENSPVCTKIVDSDFNLQYMSKAGIKQMKIKNIDDYYGLPFPFETHPDSFKEEMIMNMKTAMSESKVVAFETSFINFKGNEVWTHSTIVPVFDHNDNFDYLIVVSMDTTGNNTAKKELQNTLEREKVLANIVRTSPMAIAFGYPDGSMENCNTAFSELTGYTEEELKSLSWNHTLTPEKWHEHEIQALNKITPEKNYVKYEKEYIRKNGSIVPIELTVSARYNKKGEVIHYTGFATDISDRKKYEETILKQKANLSSLIENTNDLIWSIDSNYRLLTANNPFLEFIKPVYKGQKLTIGSLLVDPDVLPKEIYKEWKEIYDRVLGGEKYQMEYQTVYKAKVSSTLDLSYNPIYNDKNEIIGVSVFGRDITKRKKVELELKESESRFKALHNASFGGITIHDKGIILECNQGLSDITGYSIDELIGMDGLLLIAEETRDMVLDKIQTGYEKPYEAIGIRKNKEKYPVRLEARIIPYKGKKVRVVEFRDVTEEKKVEKELTKLSTAVQQGPSIIVITNLNGAIEYVNPKFTEITGYSFEEVKNKTPNILQSGVLPKDVYDKMWKTISSDKEWHGEFLNRKKNGVLYWERASVSPVRNKQGEIINYIKVAEDISEMKVKEQELQAALKKATESDRLKSAFLSNMSHEIRTPMNGILGFTELLKEPQLTGDQQEKYIEIIEKSGMRMLDTINNIIDISKIESDQVEVIKSKISLHEIFKELYDFFKVEAELKGLKLKYNTPDIHTKQTYILSDKNKIESIVSNLIKNAIKFTKKGAISFGFSLVDINNTTKLEVFVADTGIGVPKDRLNAIFNRFEQADIEDSMVYEGSGLGLSISKSYVEMLGGNLSVKSNEGVGSTFKFSIPNIEKFSENKPEQKKSNSIKEKSFNDLSILIAEDDESSRFFLKIMLSDKFKQIAFTETGKETIEYCKKNPKTDIILMDIKMPDISGLKATQEIRKFNTNIIIIAQTAYSLAGDKEKVIKAGCNNYISKPINKNELFNIFIKEIEKNKK